MKTYIGKFELLNVYYSDDVIAPCRLIAWIILKRRNSGKLLKIEQL